MFDLFRSRDKAIRIMLGAMLLLVALSMLTYLVPSYDTGTNAAGNSTVVAKVGSDTITLPEVQRLIQNTQRNRQMPPEMLTTFIPQMVQDMVTERAMAYEAQRLGFQVSDAELQEAIKQIVPTLFPDGNFVGKETYAAMLAQQNLTIPEFESDLRRQLLITRLRNIALEGTVVSPAEIEQEYKKKFEKMRLEWVKLTADKYLNETPVTIDDMKAYYNANRASYQTPETRNLVVLIADQNKIEQGLNPSEADLQRAYDQNKDQYRTPERIKVRHILLKTTDKPASEEPKIKAKADDLLKQLRAGANFADLAKKNSEDTATAPNGGDLPDWVTRGQTVPEFEQVAFALKPGQISDVIKTQYGYHILQVLQHEDARVKPFAEVKGELATQWKKQRATEMMQQVADKAQTELQRDPAHPEKVAAEMNMQLVRADGVQPGKPIPGVGTSSDFDQSVASLRKGEVSQPVALPDNKIAVAIVTDVIPARPSTFEEVQSQIRDTVARNRAQTAVQKHAQELYDKAKSMGGDLAKAAKSMGLEAKTSDPVDRSANIPGLGALSYLSDAFSRPVGTVFGPQNLPDGIMIGKVVEILPADPAKFAEQRASIRDEIKSQKARDRNLLFEAGVRDILTKEGKLKFNQNVVNQLLQQYRTS